MKKTIAIITGITGSLGKAYLERLKSNPRYFCVGISRRHVKTKYAGVNYQVADLLDRPSIKEIVSGLDFSKYKDVILIRPIGMFRFEKDKRPLRDLSREGIDKEVYASNVTTFENMYREISDKMKKDCKGKTKLTLCAFGSISDRYNIPYWNSYTRSKNILRRLIKRTIDLSKKMTIRGVFINVSTTDTGNENKLRPSGNKTYWLSSKEIVEHSMKVILKSRRSWNEINIYKHNPNFDITWYTNHENVLERWERQMREKTKSEKEGKNE